ncbi:MAG: non-ribosomal peptide synthase/polyketide synthase [Halanaerobiales bacterium]|nr:non-ribosomal peptide synthase/polyketide synthase [Halanaerobiales bacterium]
MDNTNIKKNILLSDGKFDTERNYWLQKLDSSVVFSYFLNDFSKVDSRKREVLQFSFLDSVIDKISALSKNSDFALFTILLTIFKCMLYKYSGEQDLVIGTTIFTKESDDNFLNKILPLRDIIKPNQICKELLLEVKNTVVEANNNQNYPVEEIFSELDLPLFKIGFILENIQSKVHFKAYDLDIVVSFLRRQDLLEGKFEYNPGLYTKDTIERIITQFKKVAELFMENINSKIDDLNLLTIKEREQLIYDFNDTKIEYQKDKTIQQLFEEEEEKRPDQTAIIFEDQKITYKELNNRANQLAKILRGKGIKQDQIVGVLLQRSLEMIIGILGILKAGGAYLPLDPDYPTERIKYMLEDSHASLLLLEKDIADIGEFRGERINLADEKLYIGDSSNPVNVNQAKDLAYVIYTSGSTGNPKGVMIEHRSVHNFITAISDQIEFTPEKTILSLTTFSFDIFVLETLVPLTRGMKVVIANEKEQMIPELFNDALLKNDVDMLQSTPSRMQLLISDESNLEGIRNLKEILIGGEAFPEILLEKLTSLTKAKIYNMYGPTETTVWSMIKDLTHEKDITIGKPIGNTDVYIFDKSLNLVPLNVPGDLYIAGDGLARGYLNEFELTEERFIAGPFGEYKKMYKTGDTARWLPNGDIEFLGRSDYQVKIRGYRIELGEIEKQIVSYPNVKDAVVVDKEDATTFKILVAYIVTDEELSVVDIRTHLAKTLPDYMIPSYFIKLDQLPLTPNGKLNRKGLPKLDKNILSGREYIAPTNEKEERLVSIFSEVLEIKKIGIKDNFFESGGHSLKATTLISKIYKEFSINLSLRQLFESPTVEGLAKYLNGADETAYQKIELTNKREYYQLSSAQKRLFVLNQMNPDSTNYNILGFMYIEGNLNIERLEKTFKELINRHESFRTSFEVVDGEVVQKIYQDMDFEVSHLNSNEDNLEKLVQEFVQPFDLSKAPLLRVGLVNLPDKYLLMFDLHHIIADGASLGILTNEFISLYQGYELPDFKIQYKDFAVWQNELFQSENIKNQEKYWLEVFKGEIPVLNLTTDYPRPMEMNFEGERLHFEISKDMSEKLNKLAVQNEATMYMTLLALYNIFLSKYTAQEDIFIGSPIAGRTHIELANIIGMFANTLVMRSRPIGDKTFVEFLGDVKENTLLAFENQDYPFEMLVDKLNLRSKNRNPLFDTMFVLQNASKEVQIDQLKFTPYTFENKVARFDLTLACAETNNGIVMNIEYRTQLFRRETIAKFKDHFINLIEQVVNQSDQKLRDIEMISGTEKEQILYKFNARKVDYPNDKYIYHLFEEQVERTPEDHIAIICGNQELTYSELNSKANQLARVLRNKGVKPRKLVGIIVERSFDLAIGLLGILKAGGVYVPIDSKYPKERINYILEDSSAEILLTQSHLVEQIPFDGESIFLDNEELYKGDDSNLNAMNQANDLAYVIYTSGTTGKPKGVMIEHCNLADRMNWWRDEYKLNMDDRTLHLLSFAFDAFGVGFYGPLVSGAQMVLVNDDELKDLLAIKNYIANKKVTRIGAPPSILQGIVDCIIPEEARSLRTISYGGEKISTKLIAKIKELNEDIELINEYGPTENTITSTICRNVQDCSQVTIGKPVSNTQVYILDKHDRITPIGVPGELCLSGTGVARGYLNRLKLTEEKFVINPYTGERMYRTGDFARWLPNGEIDFLGRIDDQVKVRGFRIELAGIETELLQYKGIAEAVVIDSIDQSGHTYLAAYIVTEDELSSGDLRKYLAKNLPEYMIPSYFIKLDKIPLTVNHKVDRNALPKPDKELLTEYVPPTNEIEEKLTRIWSEILSVEKIGINDDFFDIGGHSLKATSLVAKIYKECNVEIPVREIFKNPTIKELAEYISQTEIKEYIAVEPVEERVHYPVSSAQKRLYIINQIENRSTHYNMPGFLLIEGQLNVELLELAFKQLIQRHESLRTSFKSIGGEIVQIIHQEIDFEVVYCEASEDNLKNLTYEFVKPFDLNQAPLLRVSIVKTPNNYLLMFDLHHIISDGVSMGILINDFIDLYQGKELDEMRIQYKDFAVWQNNFFESEEMQKQEEYWLNKFAGKIPVLNLTTDYARPAVQRFEGGHVNFAISKELTTVLNDVIKDKGVTLFMFLLATYNIILSQYSGQEDIVVGIPIAGRAHSDLEKIIGMFVNTLALRNQPHAEKKFVDFLEEVKINALAAYENQDYQFEMIVEKLKLERNLSRNPLFDVVLDLQNMDTSVREIDNLRFRPYEFTTQTTKFNMALHASEVNGTIEFILNYNSKLFKKKSIEKMTERFKEILSMVAKDPEIPIAQFKLLSEVEEKLLLHDFNQNLQTDIMSKGSIQKLFYQMVDRYPEKIVLEYGQQTIPYAELDERSNLLANWIITKGYKKGSHIGILVDNRIELITIILASLKSGVVFIPFDAAYPSERLAKMMRNVNLNLIFTDFNKTDLAVEIFVNNDQKPEIAIVAKIIEIAKNTLTPERPQDLSKPNDSAYIYFTSGSTGQPKGILGRYAGLLHFINWEIEKFQIDSEYRISQLTAPTFDAFLRDVFVPLCVGGTLCIPDEKEILLDANKLVEWIDNSRINLIHCVPSIFKLINIYDLTSKNFAVLKFILMSGERVKIADLLNWYDIFDSRIQLVNLYGASETTMIKMVYLIKASDLERRIIPIGEPLTATKVLIADENLNPCKPGIIGDIYIRTPYMSLGYYNDSKLTAEKFVQNPWIDNPCDLVYKTGDQGRVMPDGNIEFIGRKDSQVKIRGVRVEIGDIENQILQNESIKEVVVTDRLDADGNLYLVAYCTVTQKILLSKIREYLAVRLPEYMQPTYFVELDKMPMTLNGKIDRKALPEPDHSLSLSVEYVAPQNDIEKRLAKIWSKILSVEKIGVYDKFFDLGGHSLKAINFTMRVKKEFDVEMPLTEIFKTPTIKELAQFIKNAEEKIYKSIEPVEEREYYSASSAQKRLYILNQMDRDRTNYNMLGFMYVEGDLDKERFEQTFKQLVQRHESFRSSFESVNGEIIQRIHSNVDIEIFYLESQEEKIEELAKEFVKPFDLSEAPLVRAALVKLPKRYLLMYDMHHIISDGVSMNILVNDFVKLYQGMELPELKIQYKDFAIWQNQLFSSDAILEHEKYWLESFAGEIPVLDLPTDYQRPNLMSFEGERYHFEISKELQSHINELASKNGATLYMILLAVYNLLLAKYTSQEDIIVGSPIAGRSHADLEKIIGMFVNTLVIRNHPVSGKNFLNFLKEVKENTLKAFENQDYQFEMLIDKLNIKRDLSHNPLFDAMFILQNVGMSESVIGDIKFIPYDFENKVAKFDLSMLAIETNNGIRMILEYRTRLFKRETMERLASHFINLIEQIVVKPELILGEFEITSSAEKQQLLYEFNDTNRDYSEETIDQLFEAQVKRRPDQIAVIFEDEQLTYEELNQRANQLATILRQKGVREDQFVGIMVERSIEMIVGMLAVLKAGGAYLPIDPENPLARIQFMLEDSDTKILLTQNHLAAKVQFAGEVIDLTDQQLCAHEVQDIKPIHHVKNLAYLIYTSGSTGQPKGVILEHQGIANLKHFFTENLGINEEDRIIQFASSAFDASVWEIYMALLTGARLYLINKDIINDYHKFSCYLNTNSITIATLPPVYLTNLNHTEIKHLRMVITAGSTTNFDLVKRWNQNIEYINAYGPTETTICTSIWKASGENDYKTVPIGKPIENTQVYILDSNDQLAPIGVIGELCVSGVTLARGYLNRPELTSEKFVNNPYTGERMYRTGDLARWLPDGNIEFIGRRDYQVKVRGYRVELGEIEKQLLRYPKIKEAVVVEQKLSAEDNYLAAYVVSDEEVIVTDLKAYLKTKLPDYMIPTYFIRLDKLPLTISGKVDRKALPKPEDSLMRNEFVAPTTEIEAKLLELWTGILGKEGFGVTDNFFDLGGHSLKATSLIARIHKEFSVEILLGDIFKKPTIRELAGCIENATQGVYASIELVGEREYYPTSSAQKRIFILNQLEQKSINYNMPGFMYIEGELDKERFRYSFEKLVERHESFRTSFESIDGNIIQKVSPSNDIEFEIKYFIAIENELPELIKEFIKPFNLSKIPLFRVGLVTLPNKYVLMFDMPHIIADGVSMSIVINDFMRIYSGEELSELRIQYKDFAVWQNQFFNSDKIKLQEEYWLKTFAGEIPVLNMPTDYQRSRDMKLRGGRVSFEIGEELTDELNTLISHQGVTTYMALLAVYNLLLSKYANQDDIVVGTPIAGRSHSDLEKIIGMFVNTLAIRNYPTDDKTFSEFLDEVKENALKSYENQDYPFEMLVERLELDRDLSRNPLFDIMFVLQNLQNTERVESNLKFTPVKYNNTAAKFDLEMNAFETKNGLLFDIAYSTSLYKRETIERMAEHYKNIFRQVVQNSEIKIKDIEMVTDEERRQILYEFNDTKTEFCNDRTIYQLIEKEAETNPDKVALKYIDKEVTYLELNQNANQLARILQAKGLQSDQLVGILFERFPLMIESILAVWKAGGGYIPIDPNYPMSRITGILGDSEAVVLLTESQFIDTEIKNKYSAEIIELDVMENEIRQQNVDNLDLKIDMNSLSYVIYTSGSTGKPKGAMVEHIGMMNHIRAKINDIKVGNESIVAQNSSHCFDISVWQFFVGPAVGGKTIIYPNEVAMNPEIFIDQIIQDQVTILEVVPSFLASFLDFVELKFRELNSLEYLLVTGEAVKPNLVERWFNYYPNIPMVNAYGPTEASDDITHYFMDKTPEFERVPIGKPLQNFHIYIVDKNMKLVPIGVQGEIVVSGIGVGRGYLNDPIKTKKVFMEDPFIDEKGVRLYKTGDLGCWMKDGVIEFFGRIDHQVKIRGFRIELGEIESKLVEHDKVKESVVLDFEDMDGSKYLCAYIATDEDIDISKIRKYLLTTLPEYMVPGYFITLDRLPLNSNGKIDRKALPKPDRDIISTSEFIEPTNLIEEKLSDIWVEILGVERVSIMDNFFEIGGHSLKATSLVSKVFKELNVDLPLREIFKTPTIKELAEYIQKAEKNIYTSIEPTIESEYYPVSSAQKRLYILNQFELNNTSYNIPGVMIIEGKLDIERLKIAFERLIQRHESLHTSFKSIDGEIVQVVEQNVEFNLQYLEESSKEVKDLVKEFIKPFNLANAPLLRVKVVKRADGYLFMYDMHHIISDGVSMGILINDLISLYQGNQLPEPRIQYKDFAVWQNKLFQSKEIEKQEAYWLELFKDEIPILNMPTDAPRPRELSFAGNRIYFEIDGDLQSQLNELASQNGATIYMVLLSAYNILLSKYTLQEDIIVGSPIAGRSDVELEQIIGMFINTLAMRNRPAGDKTFIAFLNEVKENALKAYENQDYQFEMLVEKLNNRDLIPRDLSRNPLFDTMFILQNAGDMVKVATDLKVIPYQFENKVAKFDLTLTATERREGIRFELEYSTKLYERETIEIFSKHFIQVLFEMVNYPEAKLSNLEIISEEEKEKLLIAFNDTEVDYQREKTIHQLFEEQVKKTPENIAICFKDKQLSYRELNEKANQLANSLRENGLRENQLVGLMVYRSIEMMVGLMGILKAGGVYLPIDLEFPEERIKYMLEDSNTEILLTQTELIDKISFTGKMFDLEDSTLYSKNAEALLEMTDAQDLAYIIYTSGSTGKPKGVMIEHRSVNNFIKGIVDQVKFTSDKTILSLTTISFDIFVLETVLPLTKGLKVVIATEEEQVIPELMNKAIIKHEVDMLQATPSRMQLLLSEESSLEGLKRLEHILIGGEAFPVKLLTKLQKLTDAKIYNMYGPTETTVWSTMQDVTDKHEINIGKPIANTKVYILDKDLRLVPQNVIGQLYIAGDGLARGYLNRPDLTAEKFITNPFNSEERIYKTGDLARWLPNGEIEFIGRRDYQVKIRGYRIEIGEIEIVLLKHSKIKEVVVSRERVDQIDQTGNHYLVAYFVSVAELSIVDLREYLKSELPEYMIPSYFVGLDQLPLTPNGKINRNALPAYDGTLNTGVEYVAPTNEIERKLVEIWSNILGVEKIGRNDNFFELGGHSLKATSLISQVYKAMNVNLPLREVFRNPILKNLAELIRGADKNLYSRIEVVAEREYYPVTSAQKRLYVLMVSGSDNISYNMPELMNIEGELDIECFEKAFDALILRHESLRTSFEFIDVEVVQKIHQNVDFTVQHLEADEAEVENLVSSFVEPFNLSKAPLLRVNLVKIKDAERYVLMYDIHHIISDGISMNILVSDFINLYQGNELPKMRIQYKDFAVWQNELFKSGEIVKQEVFWLDTFKDGVPVLNMPTDYQRPKEMDFAGARITLVIEKEVTDKLNDLANRYGATMFIVLLSIYNILLSKYALQEDIVVGSTIAGRAHPDLESIIGMFVNTLVMRNYPESEKTFADFLLEVKENALQVYDNQDYPFEMLVEKLNLDIPQNRNPLFDTVFVLQNFDMAEVQVESLRFIPYKSDVTTANFDIMFIISERESGLIFNIQYKTKLYTKETMEMFAKDMSRIIDTVVDAENIQLKDIALEDELEILESVADDVDFDF